MEPMLGQWRRRSLVAVTLAGVVPIAIAFVVLFAGTGFRGVFGLADAVEGPRADDLVQLAPVGRQVRDARRLARATAPTATPAAAPAAAGPTAPAAPAVPVQDGPATATTPAGPAPATTPPTDAPATTTPPATAPGTAAPAPATPVAAPPPAATPSPSVQDLVTGVGGALQGTGELAQGLVEDVTAPPGSGGAIDRLGAGVRDTVGGLTGTGSR